MIKKASLSGVFLLSLVISITGESLSAHEGESSPNKEILERQTKSRKISPKLGVTYYFDSREYNTLAINYSSKSLPGGLLFWGFVDLHGKQELKGVPEDATRGSRADLDDFFTENRLTKMIGHGFGFQVEYNDANGSGNDLLRLGIVYTLPIKGQFLQLRVHPLETDGDGGQASVVGSINLWEKKLFLEGFFDHNFNNHSRSSHKHASDKQVAEAQLRYMVTENIGIVSEYRVSEFLRSPTSRKHRKGIAFGLTYKF